jgi:hypothetical protein
MHPGGRPSGDKWECAGPGVASGSSRACRLYMRAAVMQASRPTAPPPPARALPRAEQPRPWTVSQVAHRKVESPPPGIPWHARALDPPASSALNRARGTSRHYWYPCMQLCLLQRTPTCVGSQPLQGSGSHRWSREFPRACSGPAGRGKAGRTRPEPKEGTREAGGDGRRRRRPRLSTW